jgi:hypothetical protein
VGARTVPVIVVECRFAQTTSLHWRFLQSAGGPPDVPSSRDGGDVESITTSVVLDASAPLENPLAR